MKRNFHYVLTATPAKSGVKIKNYSNYFQTLILNFNNHATSYNPKEIDSITLSPTVDNAIVIDFWSEKELPAGRELQSLRRLSEDLAVHDKSIVANNSRVLISAL